MASYITAQQFMELKQNLPVIDVRSPAEYEFGHVQQAVNLPIFDNQERALVGTRYKKSGREYAIELGLDIVGPKLTTFVKEAKKIAPQRRVIIHCWRGGMRSASMGWLFETAGFEVFLLQGGYKEYRRYIREQFSKATKLLILSGYTGSGKTDILKDLKKMGQQVVDLEGFAHHKGSAFGAIGQEPQPTNEQFENNLADEWHTLNMMHPIWIEDESITMGKNGIPDTLFASMRAAKVIRVDIPREVRAKRLVQEYACFDTNLLYEAIIRIQSKLGGLRTTEALDALMHRNFEKVALITLEYYDKAYLKGLEKRDPQTIHSINIHTDEPSKTADVLIKFIRKISL